MLEVDSQLINVAEMGEIDLNETKKLIQVSDTQKRKAQTKMAPEYHNFCFQLTGTCPDSTNFEPLHREKFEQLLKLEEMQKIHPKSNHQELFTFLS